jgi:hypothetical protein
MKTTKFMDENNVEWDITINYMDENITTAFNTTGNEIVRLKSSITELDLMYPYIPIGLKFRITPTTTNDGIKTYGYLSYDGEFVCSFDPEL